MDSPVTGWRRFTMEPLVFVLMFGFAISDNLMTDLIVYQTCKTLLGNNASDCDILHENSSSNEAKEVEKQVQPHAGPVLALRTCIELIFPAFLALFLGPWSDKNGRKPLLIFPLVGEILRYVGYALVSAFNINFYWILIPSIPLSILGGFPPIPLAFYCYITDISNENNRSWRLACLETATLTGMLSGLFVCPLLFKMYGYISVFSMSATIYFLALLYVIFVVQETIVTDRKRTIKSIFNFSLLKELFDSVTKSRDGFDKLIVWSSFGFIAIYKTVMEGNMSIAFLFSSSQLGWNLADYSIYSAIRLIIFIGGMLLLIKFAGSILKLPDVVINVTSCLSIGASSLMRAFITKPWQMYLSSGIEMFATSNVPLVKSIVSKSVPQKDVGKVFSLTSVIELIVPMAAKPLYIFVYTHTLNIHPCPVWFLSTVLPLAMIILAVMIEVRWKKFKNIQYSTLVPVEN